jgi:hypothetical protein
MSVSAVKILGVGFGVSTSLIVITFVMFIFNIFTFNEFISILIGCVIPTVNIIIGILLVKKLYKADYTAFVKGLIGGMTARLLSILLIVFVVVKFLDISRNNFIFSLLFFYFFYLIIEVFYINLRKITVKNGG